MSRYKTYPKYEGSRVEWADRTPKHWSAVHLRWIAKLYAGGTPSKAIEEYWENGSVPWINSGEVNQGLISKASTYITEAAYNNSSAKWIPKNALVMALAGQGKTKGMVAQLAIDATCNQSMAAIVPHDLQSSRYLFWWLYSNYQNIRNMAGGDLRDGLNLELLGDIGCPIPNKEEQKSIAAFLDHEAAKIDALIEKQQRLIELLKEKRQAVINHAVTKGLNPNAPMKDSGVEWLGEVPSHWDVLKLGYLMRFRGGAGFPDSYQGQEDHEIPFYKVGDLARADSEACLTAPLHTITRDTAKELRATIFDKGSIVFAKVGAALLLKRFCMLDKPSCIDNNMMGAELGASIELRDFLLFLMPLLDFELIVNPGAVPSVNGEQISSIWIALPPKDEQIEIVNFLKISRIKFDCLISSAEQTISLFQERRTALISAAVTGKIDVRDWQAAA